MTLHPPPAPLGAYRVASVRIKRRRGRQPVVVAELAPTIPGDQPMTYYQEAAWPPAKPATKPTTKPARAAKLATKPLNLYLLTQTQNTGHDTFDACIVAAPNPRAAKCIHPKPLWLTSPYSPWEGDSWATQPEDVTARLIGTAKPGTKPGVILASFNAG